MPRLLSRVKLQSASWCRHCMPCMVLPTGRAVRAAHHAAGQIPTTQNTAAKDPMPWIPTLHTSLNPIPWTLKQATWCPS